MTRSKCRLHRITIQPPPRDHGRWSVKSGRQDHAGETKGDHRAGPVTSLPELWRTHFVSTSVTADSNALPKLRNGFRPGRGVLPWALGVELHHRGFSVCAPRGRGGSPRCGFVDRFAGPGGNRLHGRPRLFVSEHVELVADALLFLPARFAPRQRRTGWSERRRLNHGWLRPSALRHGSLNFEGRWYYSKRF